MYYLLLQYNQCTVQCIGKLFLYNYDGMCMVRRTVHTTQISCYSVKFIIATCDIMISNIIIIAMF